MCSKWNEVRAFVLPEGGFVSVDAWLTNNSAELGRTIAVISSLLKGGNPVVCYLDSNAETDPYAQEVIAEALKTLKTENR